MVTPSKEKIGFYTATSWVVGNMIGSGIFILPASLVAYGSAGLIGWIFSAIGALFLSYIFSDLSKRYPNAIGGPYIYAREKLGHFPAYLVAWGYWVSIWCTNAAIAVALVGYLGVFFPLLTDQIWISLFTAFSIVWLLTAFHSRPLVAVGRLQLFTTWLKVVPLVFFAFIGLFFIEKVNFFPVLTSGFNWAEVILATTTLTFFAFLGMECATIPAGEVENPTVTIPRATIAGTLITMFIYLAGSVVVIGLVPPHELISSGAPFADAAGRLFGTSGKYMMAACAVIATFGALNGWLMVQGLIPKAAADDGMFPRVFGRTNLHNSPIYGMIISSILITALLAMNYSQTLTGAFAMMMKLSTLSVIIPYVFSATAYALLPAKNKEKSTFRYLVALFSLIFLLLIVAGCGQEIVYLGFLLLLAGIPFYIWLKSPKK